ncbi:MAG TPA: T9SS type A sorting domain-containing protein [Phnomibacter sp.]|nr:T9SS type A sorting domain-containing protein [Phnomibacter sp.]
MLRLLLSVALFLSVISVQAQTVTVSGQCITGSIVLNNGGTEAGKPYYTGTGTVAGTASVAVSIFWIGTPDNVWVLAFDGQPYFSNSCAYNKPPGTASPYCTWVPVSGTSCTSATPLLITGDVMLPVTWLELSGTSKPEGVVLNWATASEYNNKGFDVQRSEDGSGWTTLGFVAGQGNSIKKQQYQYTDHQPISGNNYYRLRQVDIDGNISISSIVQISHAASKQLASLRNNPANGHFILSVYQGAVGGSLQVTDLTGKVIFHKQALVAGNCSIDISTQPAGVYFLRVTNGAATLTQKLIKQ